MKQYILFFIFSSFISFSFSQEESEEEPKNYGSITYALSYVPKGSSHSSPDKEGHFLPGFGFDYMRKVTKRLEVGLMFDVELSEYLISSNDNLPRENALILCLVGNYELMKNWGLFFGGGVESDKHKTFGIVRVGTEYNFPILPNNWSLPVGVFYDFNSGYDTWSLSIGLGKRF